MSQLASPSQLRMSLLRWALFVVPTIMLLGFLSGTVSGSGEQNSWFAELVKPEAQPPGWAFGVVWPILYLLMGIAFSMILNARGARLRGISIALFLVQLALNLYWSPLFFGQHQVTAALGDGICHNYHLRTYPPRRRMAAGALSRLAQLCSDPQLPDRPIEPRCRAPICSCSNFRNRSLSHAE